jgi:hypothetical protein
MAVVRKLIVGMVMAGALMLGTTRPAVADSTCYTGCGPVPETVVGAGPSIAPSGPSPQSSPAPVPLPIQSAPPAGGLPVTGADIAQSAAAAAVLLVAGVAMIRINRRRTASAR